MGSQWHVCVWYVVWLVRTSKSSIEMNETWFSFLFSVHILLHFRPIVLRFWMLFFRFIKISAAEVFISKMAMAQCHQNQFYLRKKETNVKCLPHKMNCPISMFHVHCTIFSFRCHFIILPSLPFFFCVIKTNFAVKHLLISFGILVLECSSACVCRALSYLISLIIVVLVDPKARICHAHMLPWPYTHSHTHTHIHSIAHSPSGINIHCIMHT